MSEAITPPTLTEVIREALDARLESVRVAMPGIVQAYNAATQSADVLPSVRGSVLEVDGSLTPEALPVIPDVPVMFPRAGGFFLSFPLIPGDSVLLVFSESDLGEWRRVGSVVDPGDTRRHTLAGAIAIPGLFPATNTITPAPNGAQLGSETGVRTTFTVSQVQVGGASDAAALASRVDLLQTAHAGHTHIGVPAVGLPSPVYTPVSSASAILKVGG